MLDTIETLQESIHEVVRRFKDATIAYWNDRVRDLGIPYQTGEQWGKFAQTYSMVGLINAAIRLSKRWDWAL